MDAIQEFLSKIGEGLRSLAGSVEALGKQVESYAKKQAESPVVGKTAKKAKAKKEKRPAEKKAASAKKGPAKRKAVATARKPKKATAASVVLEIIKGTEDGVSTAVLKEKTGFNDKKVANCIYRLKKQGVIQSTKRGIYTSV